MSEFASHIDVSPRSGHLAIVGAGVYAVFQTSLVESASYLFGAQWYSYGRLEASRFATDSLVLERSADGKHLLPTAEAPFDIQFHDHMLVVAGDKVAPLVTQLGGAARKGMQADLGLAAEHLYETVCAWDQPVDGEKIGTCGVYDVTADRPRLVLVNAVGGYSIGLAASEGLIREEDLRGGRNDSLHRRRLSVTMLPNAI